MRSALLLFLLICAGCADKNLVSEIEMTTTDQSVYSINPSDNKLTVVFFLSPECPLCINYTLAMKDLANEFQNDSVAFYGIHSGDWFSANEVEDYALKYDLPFTMLLDNGNQLATTLNASITPEVFVLNSSSENMYSGKIDNWVNELGKKKLEVTEHYLKNALVALDNGKEVNPKRTEPMGCLIE